MQTGLRCLQAAHLLFWNGSDKEIDSKLPEQAVACIGGLRCCLQPAVMTTEHHQILKCTRT